MIFIEKNNSFLHQTTQKGIIYGFFIYFCLMKIFRLWEVGFRYARLLLPDENIHRHSVEVPLGTNLILEEALVWVLHILWQVRKEEERRHTCLVQLHTVLDFDILTLD